MSVHSHDGVTLFSFPVDIPPHQDCSERESLNAPNKTVTKSVRHVEGLVARWVERHQKQMMVLPPLPSDIRCAETCII